MLTRLGITAAASASRAHWTDVIGVARSLLALGSLGTVLASAPTTLFRPAFGLPLAPYCTGAGSISIFCVVPRDQLDLARTVAIAVLLVVASGWRPRWTALPHWWVSFSVAGSITIPDGGDQVTAVLTLLLVPIALTDPRPWHWSAPGTLPGPYRGIIALSARQVIRLQVAGIYLHASLAKLAVPEWQDGTALYYWLNDPFFGPAPWLRPAAVAVAANPLGGTLLTWGTIALEFTLALGLVLGPRHRAVLLAAGILFHVGIAVLMGLVSFALAMIAALILFLRPAELEFGVAGSRIPFVSARRAIGRRGPLTQPQASTMRG